MKHFNWLVKLIFYKHQEKKATVTNTQGDSQSVFYPVSYLSQQHANLCTDASENMLYYFIGNPIATMNINSRGTFQGREPDNDGFELSNIAITEIKQNLKDNGPFILALPLKYGVLHSVVVIGFSNNQLIYHDPLTGPNRIMSIDELTQLNGDKKIEIAQPKFFNGKHFKKQSSTFEQGQVITLPKKYAYFFSPEKMSYEARQCQAIIDFLTDYAKNSLWNIRKKHKNQVKKFLMENNKIKSLSALLVNLKTLENPAKSTKKDLYARLQTIKLIFGRR
ncbi:uncharacterized protein RVIR1_07830 [Candidatus Rickettsiella viridis]|uniref:Peptidase C39-like domain-containing protein n=1 Tax=Candidatus Rickettsiella viridis TaxID=676208 RepID=A0A2Z5V4A3_9COXI|nr:papain-like cysteine protease family protein [Candidatus Rickettsiella viridis]BBB15272.1 uncharacterized protein RVIR1_07830 [Candidatus Rickettsiella viridis]